ncbi:phosphatase PAP2 family protein [Spiroplasma sp. BIUS-1]|uniref:phosphatase PAP2 family protein n=1 Tax=Spiroplasma sp. BIUS-1 TaxID=216964 RepID=UPI0013988E91|nr:phosphatase PAP2 family protein [Spiroplasma sp. BIUS-1]QHX36427.1 hypothetical protein SBIUS_v1c01740 [Spiroplasma sp. BIUS-1]
MFRNRKTYIFIFLASIILAYFVLASLFDYDIAVTVSGKFKNGFFTLFFDTFAQVLIFSPLFLIFSIYSLKFTSFLKFKINIKILIQTIIIFLFTGFLIVYLFLIKKDKIVDYSLSIKLITFFTIFISLSILNIYVLKVILKNDEVEINQLVYKSNIVVIFLVLSWLNVILFKYIFGRNRPEDVIENNASFQYIFQINFNRTKTSTSFPSGHTMSAGQLIVFCYFLDFKKTKKERILKSILLVTIGFLIIATAISRILMQKHFLTDVSFSVVIIAGYYFLAPIIVNKINRRINNG